MKKVLLDKPNDEIDLFCTDSREDISNFNYFIVIVPTPVNKKNGLDLKLLYKSGEYVGKVLKKK